MSINKDSQKTPNLRFKGFTDDWEQRELIDVSKITMGQSPDGSNYTQNSSDHILVQGNADMKNGKVTPRIWTTQVTKIANKNDIILGVRAPVGVVGTTDYDVVIGRGVAGIKGNTFIYYDLVHKYYNNYWTKYSTGSTFDSINADDIKNASIHLPNLSEQTKIGNLLNIVDNIFTLHQRKLDQLKQLKEALLQQMFPGKGETVPKLRFAGFEGDWEERKLSSGLREYTDRVIVEDDKEYYQISVRNNFGGITLRGSKMGNKIGRKRQAKINLTKYPQTLIFTRQTVEQGGIGWVDKYCDGAIVTENMPTISLDTSVFSKHFLTSLFQTRIFYKNAILDNIDGGSAQIAIHESKFLSSTLLFPNLDEQEKIGSFFQYLDDTITLQQRKLDQLQNIKQVLLENMFI